MKAKSVKKIIGIVVVSIVLALTVATIILALIPKKLYNPIPHNDFAGVTVWRSTLSNSYYWDEADKDSEANQVINELLVKIEDSVQENILSSMFQGALNHDIEVVKTTKNSNLKSLYDGQGVLALVFNYLDDIQTLKINDKVFKYETAVSSTTIEYSQIIMPLVNSDSYEECTLYFVKDNATEYKLTYYAHQSDLWNYIVNDDKFDWPLSESN